MRTTALLRLSLAALLISPVRVSAYENVKNDKVVTIPDKKSVPSLVKIDRTGRLWMKNDGTGALEIIDAEGKPDVVLAAGKKKGDLFKDVADFAFMRNGAMIIADAGFSQIQIVGQAGQESGGRELVPVEWKRAKALRTIACPKPSCVAVSQDDVIAVGNPSDNRVDMYSLDGTRLHALLPPESHSLKDVTAVAFSPSGLLWVLDASAGKLHRFSRDRKWLGVMQDAAGATALVADDFGFAYFTVGAGRFREVNSGGSVTGTFGSKGKGIGQFASPSGIAVDSQGKLWVADRGNKRIQSFLIVNKDRKSLQNIQPAAYMQVRRGGSAPARAVRAAFSPTGQMVVLEKDGKSTLWDDKGQLKSTLGRNKKIIKSPSAYAYDPSGALWVADEGDDQLKKIDESGNPILSLGQKGRAEGSLNNPSDFTFRTDGSVVVADKGGSRVQVLNAEGVFLFMLKGAYKNAVSVAANDERIALVDADRKALMFFDSTGKFLSEVANIEGRDPVWKAPVSVTSDSEGRFFVLDEGFDRVRVYSPVNQLMGEFEASGRLVVAGPDRRLAVFDDKAMTLYQVHMVPREARDIAAEAVDGDIKVTWTAVPDAASYKVFRSSGGGFTEIGVSSATPFVDRDFVPSVMYTYALRGVSGGGYEGDWAAAKPVKAPRRKDVSMVSIQSIKIDPVFTAAFKYYVDHPFGAIELRNNNDQPYRNIKMALGLKNYADFPTEIVVNELAAGETKAVPVTMTFNNQVLELSENTPVQMDVRVTFFEENAEKTVSQTAPLTLYSRNAISWIDKARIASFITPRDVPITEYSRIAMRAFIANFKNTPLPKSLIKMALMYESLSALGIAYVPDPTTPYAQVSNKPDALDYVQFPRDTLRRRTGDCDDTTALLSSMLESVGVATALVDTPTHIFLMAEVGPDIASIGMPAERFEYHDGTYWVPIETTRFNNNFLEAWQKASGLLNELQDKNEVEFLRVAECQKRYPPVTLVEKEMSPVSFPEDRVRSTYPAILKKMSDDRYATLLSQAKAASQASPEDGMLKAGVGLVHAESGRVAEARAVFEPLTRDAAADVRSAAYNNLGNLSFLENDFAKAADYYAKAGEAAPKDGGVLINRARTALKLGDKDAARKFLQDAKAVMDDWRRYVGDMPGEILPK